MGNVVLIIFILLGARSVFANSCCGQSPASFTVLSMNQRMSLSTGFSYLRSQGRVRDNSEKFYVWGDKKREVRSIPLNLASVFADRQQLFLNLVTMQGSYSDRNESGATTHLSDTLMGYSYEVLPEYNFSYWKPIVYATVFLNIPTGHSIYDSARLSEGADVTGHGQWGAGLGITLRKVYFPWTITLQARTIQLLAEEFENSRVSDFYDSSAAFLLSYSSQWWGLMFNGGVTFTHLSERRLEPSQITSSVSQNFNVLGGVQRALSGKWMVGINYSDQTLFGPAKNTLLNRSINLNFNYNYL